MDKKIRIVNLLGTTVTDTVGKKTYEASRNAAYAVRVLSNKQPKIYPATQLPQSLGAIPAQVYPAAESSACSLRPGSCEVCGYCTVVYYIVSRDVLLAAKFLGRTDCMTPITDIDDQFERNQHGCIVTAGFVK